ncbi:hypothetical protein DL764_000441 [Monosporascus ibericus]|uniref:Uncharacterized protein n=1 Tax=Monosporascus ibericus TaxID=155417 RepID=A0A4V1XCT0_9PEZI|nr:hypothetical protein DL764_000441 [Monosporascus ibericus]
MQSSGPAKEHHDKVYALLGMSSDDPAVAGLSADYEVSWRQLFRQLIHFILSKRVSVDTWDDMEIAVIKGKGCILGEVSSVERDTAWEDKQHVGITWKDFDVTRAWSSCWTFQTSAKSVQVGDVVCLLQGASRPTILRLCSDYWAIIIIAVPRTDDLRSTTRHIKWSELLQSMTIFPHDFLLVWDWDMHPDEPRDREDYEDFVSSRVPKCSEAELEDCLDEATRLQNVRLVLQEMKKFEVAVKNLQKATNVFERALTSMKNLELTCRGHRRWGEGDVKKLEVLVDLVIKDKGQWTLLCLAAEKGHGALVKLLLNTGKVDSHTEDLQTALQLAALNGHKEVVTLLLDSGKVDSNAKNWEGSTTLRSAAGSGHEVVVKLLLDNGKVGLHAKDLQTALQLAAENGHDAVVKLLFDNNVDPKAEIWGMSAALSLAAEKGHEGVVQVLLDNNKVDREAESWDGSAALWLAAENGHEGVVQLLLDNNKVDREAESWALRLAAGNGHEGVVQLLLDNSKVDPNVKNWDGSRAIWSAAKSGHETVVKLLLDNGKVDPNVKGWNGSTALCAAAESGHKAVVKLLLDNSKVDPNVKDLNGSTALLSAARNGHETIVKLLLDTGKIDSHAEDPQTALWLAAKNGHKAVVKLLLHNAKIDPNIKSRDGSTALFSAARNGHETVVKLLLDTNKVDSQTNDLQTALRLAEWNRHEAVVRLLRNTI